MQNGRQSETRWASFALSFLSDLRCATQTPKWLIPNFILEGISTSTHIILTRAALDNSVTCFEAFPLPLLESHGHSTPLKISHRGVILGIGAESLELLHEMCDPFTQDIIITLRVMSSKLIIFGTRRYNSNCGALRLCKSRHGEVGGLTFRLFDSIDRDDRLPFIRSPFNGTRRVFHSNSKITSGTFDVSEYAVLINGNETKVREYPAVLQFPPRYRLLDYDPYRGCLCFNTRPRLGNKIEIWDLLRKPTQGQPMPNTWKVILD